MLSRRPNRPRKLLLKAAGVLVVVTGGLLFLFRTGPHQPFEDGDLRPERLELAPAQSGFALLGRAVGKLHWPQADHIKIAGMAAGNPRFPWNQELADHLLASNREVLPVFEEVLAAGRLQVPAPQSADDDYDYLSGWGCVALLATVQSAVLSRNGQAQEALNLACKVVDFGHLLEGAGGTELHYKKGVGLKILGLTRLREIAAQSALPAERWKAILRHLETRRANQHALSNALKVEYQIEAGLLEEISRGRFPGTNEVESVFTRGWGLALGHPMLKVAATRSLLAQAARVSLRSIPCPYAAMPLQELPAVPTNSSPVRAILRGNIIGESLFGLGVIAAPERVLRRKCMENVAVAATQLILALHCYQREHGSFPESLAALVPEYLPRVPLDDFDGQPFRYSRERKLVYSVGSDLSDEGGLELRGGGARSDEVFSLEPASSPPVAPAIPGGTPK